MRDRIQAILTFLGACGDEQEWLQQLPPEVTFREAYEACPNGDQLCWMVGEVVNELEASRELAKLNDEPMPHDLDEGALKYARRRFDHARNANSTVHAVVPDAAAWTSDALKRMGLSETFQVSTNDLYVLAARAFRQWLPFDVFAPLADAIERLAARKLAAKNNEENTECPNNEVPF